ncbi:hypothetical protein ACIA49_14725 [Kribbella sp. NPDC051587]|uniref:hypothetical protein n=1 Tax=Kribbella sp. NPDC051587 TaxID=3364119 RepID=UPI00378E3036
MPPHMSRRRALQLAGAATAAGLTSNAPPPAAAAVVQAVAQEGLTGEVDVQEALRWWAPQRQVWTPVGWKSHLFRFDMFYNGTMVCQPAVAVPVGPVKPWLDAYKGKDFQVTPVMPDRGPIPPMPTGSYYLYKGDFGVGIQGWRADKNTPVLWTEHRRQEGVVLRQSVFAHLRGAPDVQTALEPIYSWTRFSVEQVSEVRPPASFTFVLRLSKVYIKHHINPPQQQDAFVTMEVLPATAALDTTLRIEQVFNPGPEPVPARVFDGAGLVRMAVSVPGATTLTGANGVYDLKVVIQARKGAYVDVLVPMLPQPKAEIDAELALGYDGALAQAETYWAKKPATASAISTPEPYVDQFFRRSVQLAEIIGEKSPDTGKHTFLSGSYGYDMLWSTPTSMVSHMFLDLLGYHDVVASHLDLYLTVQGTVAPPGDDYEKFSHDGFFSTPPQLQPFHWLSDHGAILEAVCRHALLTRDQAFINRWLSPILKACDFIKRATTFQDQAGIKGLMPPAKANDTGRYQQSVSIQAWTHRGLSSAVQLLQRLSHPRAAEFAGVADAFRTAYVNALRQAAAAAPTWTDPSGAKQPILPSSFYGEPSDWPDLEAFDGGALMSVFGGLLPADDPLMTSYLEFYRVGPNVANFDPAHHTALDRVVLDHEQSSAEPCYSWNLFHSWQRGDRAHFLEGLYGLLTGAISPDTYISGEHRHGMYGTLFVQPLITWAARHAVIDDSLTAGELNLLRLCPLAWISKDSETVFDKMPTLFGPMSLRFRLSTDGKTLDVTHSTSWAQNPAKITVHRPPVPGLERLVVNGTEVK